MLIFRYSLAIVSLFLISAESLHAEKRISPEIQAVISAPPYHRAHSAEHLKKKLDIGFNQTTADGRFTLKEGECMGACGDAPVCLVNDKKMMSFMTPKNLDGLIDGLRNK